MSWSNATAVDARARRASRRGGPSGTPSRNEVDGEDDDDEVVEAADDRDVVRDDVATEDEVAGRASEERLAAGRHPLVEREREDRAGRRSGARLASGRNAMIAERPTEQARPAPAPLAIVRFRSS